MVEQKKDNLELKSLLNEEESKENAAALKKGENLNGGKSFLITKRELHHKSLIRTN